MSTTRTNHSPDLSSSSSSFSLKGHPNFTAPILSSLASFFQKYASQSCPLQKEEETTHFRPQLAPPAIAGDLTLSCFFLSKQQKRPPMIIAQEVANQLKERNFPFIQSIEAVSGHVNVFLNYPKALQEYWHFFRQGGISHFSLKNSAQNSEQESKQESELMSPDKILIEYSQPNTHKELHVGHMRNTALGNALVRLLKGVGFQVISATYPGDIGTHVAKTLWYITHFSLEKQFTAEMSALEKGELLGKFYSKAVIYLEDHPEVTPDLGEILKKIESGNGPLWELWQETRQWSLEVMKKAYEWLEISFDHWFFESELDHKSVQLMHTLLGEGKLVYSEGAIGMNLEDKDLGFCLLVKKDGNGLYATKDILLAYEKWILFKTTKSICIVDHRQTFHFKQVFEVLRRLKSPSAEGYFHLAYGHVSLPSGPMSSRKGTIIPLFHLIEEMTNHIKKEFLKKYEETWTKEQLEETAHWIADGAIKYGMICNDSHKGVVFDLKEWLKLEGNTGPYLQYTHARIGSLLELSEKSQGISLDSLDLLEAGENTERTLPFSERELELLKILLFFQERAFYSAFSLKPHILCHYLFELAQTFNSFYSECPILKATSKIEQKQRLRLCFLTQATLKKGLEFLGLRCPKQM